MTDLVFPAVEARDTQRSLRSPQLLPGRPGFREAFAGSLGDEIAFDFCEQREQGGHDLGLEVLTALEADVLLDGDEGHRGFGDRIEEGDDLAERAPEAG